MEFTLQADGKISGISSSFSNTFITFAFSFIFEDSLLDNIVPIVLKGVYYPFFEGPVILRAIAIINFLINRLESSWLPGPVR